MRYSDVETAGNRDREALPRQYGLLLYGIMNREVPINTGFQENFQASKLSAGVS